MLIKRTFNIKEMALAELIGNLDIFELDAKKREKNQMSYSGKDGFRGKVGGIEKKVEVVVEKVVAEEKMADKVEEVKNVRMMNEENAEKVEFVKQQVIVEEKAKQSELKNVDVEEVSKEMIQGFMVQNAHVHTQIKRINNELKKNEVAYKVQLEGVSASVVVEDVRDDFDPTFGLCFKKFSADEKLDVCSNKLDVNLV
ncbi:hypothetical protein L1987_42413 [Smallanthus sonchifolius]|uniref:Uncharacterized protein n=1 Tax=Smallanthus sonchifolius TaxID=185202 RepID=A0ACB9GJZ3_9ASTR|nr:hypothetical protein L1987_42413 [Smallanthus sonchifolius]